MKQRFIVMIKKEYPDEGELIVGTVIKVQNFGAFVSLDEYPGREGFIHIAEVATGWVKRIRNHIKEKQKVVCKVMGIDRSKDHVDLSLKRVNEHQKRDKIQEWKNNQKAKKLLEMVAKKLGKSIDQCYDEFGKDLIKKYGTLYAGFEEAVYDLDNLKKDGLTDNFLEAIAAVANENITIPFVEITGHISVNCWLPDGIKHIRDSFSKAEESEYEDVDIQVKYIGAPQYLITVKAPDYKIAEDQLKKAVSKIEGEIKNHNGGFEFHRKAEE
jgi:translation initiation factor 2 subunit 1